MYVHEQLTMNAFQLLNKTMFTFSGRIVSCDEQPRKLIYLYENNQKCDRN